MGVWLSGALGTWRLETLPPDTQPDFAQPDVFWLAVPAEAFNLTWRRWQPGDKIQLLGASGSRKVARILSELKVPALQRVDTYVLVDRWGQVLWLEYARNAECTRVTYPLPAGLRLLRLSKRNTNLGFSE
jgi:tRNA(Ile)-lysidine synthetase-like protein